MQRNQTDLEFHPYWTTIPRDQLNATPIDKKSFLDITLRFDLFGTHDIRKTYQSLESIGRLCGIYLVSLSEFDPDCYLFPNSLSVACVEEMGNILSLRLQKSMFNMDDLVLQFAVHQSLSKPSDYCGYHLLHYLLCFALANAPSNNIIPTFTDYPDLYNFSNAILEWVDQENIATIPRRYTDHYLSKP